MSISVEDDWQKQKKLQIPCMCSHVNMMMLQIVRCFTHTLNQQHRRSLQPAQFQGRDPRVWVCVCVYVCVCVCVCVRTCVCVWLIAGVFWVNWVNKCRLLRELIGSRSLKASSSPVGSPPSSRLTVCLFVNLIFNKRPKKTPKNIKILCCWWCLGALQRGVSFSCCARVSPRPWSIHRQRKESLPPTETHTSSEEIMMKRILLWT